MTSKSNQIKEKKQIIRLSEYDELDDDATAGHESFFEDEQNFQCTTVR
jgi:hypothetical protein